MFIPILIPTGSDDMTPGEWKNVLLIVSAMLIVFSIGILWVSISSVNDIKEHTESIRQKNIEHYTEMCDLGNQRYCDRLEELRGEE